MVTGYEIMEISTVFPVAKTATFELVMSRSVPLLKLIGVSQALLIVTVMVIVSGSKTLVVPPWITIVYIPT